MRSAARAGRGSRPGRTRPWRPAAAIALVGLALFLLGESGARGLAVVSATRSIEDLPGNRGKRYAVCVGISGYEDPGIQDLQKARNDAKALGEELKTQGQFDSVFVMTDDVDPRYDKAGVYPRLANIRARLKYLSDFVTPNDLVVFSFSGHGVANEKGDGYLVPADARAQDPFATSLAVAEVVAWLQKLKVKKSLLLLDACREKLAETASRGLSAGANLRSERFERSEVAAVFYATRTGWYSYEDPQTDFGVFTRFLLDGLRGKADYQCGNRDGIVSFKELSAFVEDAVTTYALAQGMKQRPSTQLTAESYGDLALTTYSASVDTATRSVVAAGTVVPGQGSARIYSNVEGAVQLDGRPSGTVAQGAVLVLGDIPAGPHFVQIDHAFGVLRKELVVLDRTQTSILNIVTRNDREPRTVHGVTFVHIGGEGGRSGFWIGESEVTFGQFAQFARETGYQAQGSWRQYYKPAYDFYPVLHVTWDDAVAYAKWLEKTSGTPVTLPTLAQWQRAAGGIDHRAYPWGDEWDASYCQNEASTAPGALPIVGRTGPVQVQYFGMDMTIDGVAQMAGNVREWCADQRKSAEGDALLSGLAGGSYRLSRPKYFTSDSSAWKPASAEDDDIGFRVALPGD